MDVRNETLVETPVRRSNLHRVEISCVISRLLGEDVEFGEVRFCGHFALCKAVESEGGVGLESGGRKTASASIQNRAIVSGGVRVFPSRISSMMG